MARDHFESELTGSREEIAAALSGVTDGILAGSVRLDDGADAVTVDVPEDISLEIELESEDDELSLELEMEWPAPDGSPAVAPAEQQPESSGDVGGADTGETEPVEGGAETSAAGTDASDAAAPAEGTEDIVVPVAAADASQSLARFEVFRDRGDEWRWRLRHRNGNIIATSGEGYTRKHNAWKGLRSVVQNAPEAEVHED
ncbi:amphi-Trp domain-containing protein [Halobacterium wangiae]|uniref:amphi-Trp domain-containing protein n=1 Tax=Halobacterium wangiae TaxID=2902623 RepID=UPI001E38F47A|nr:amphi-Trp domain-containing protein [Halobacterium wangiae]